MAGPRLPDLVLDLEGHGVVGVRGELSEQRVEAWRQGSRRLSLLEAQDLRQRVVEQGERPSLEDRSAARRDPFTRC